MPTIVPINLDPDTLAILRKYKLINKDGMLEALTRGKGSQFDTFFKLQLNSATKSESVKQLENIAATISSNHAQSIQMLNGLSKLSQFTMVLSGLNLFATAAGFAMMNAKLNKMSSKIDEVISRQKDAIEIDANYKIENVISKHHIMLDHRRTQKYFSEDQMEELVANEYNALKWLKKIFEMEASGNKEELMFYLVSMAAMLAVSLRYYDEIYYFENRETLAGDNVWHSSHETWAAAFDSLIDTAFIERIQDYGYFDLDLNTIVTDYYYKNYQKQLRDYKQAVEDNQLLLTSIGDPELFASVKSSVGAGTRVELEAALEKGGIDPKQCEKSISIAIA